MSGTCHPNVICEGPAAGRTNGGLTPWGLALTILVAVILIPEVVVAQSAMGEIEGRPAPVSRRQCIGGSNAGSLCNQNSDCPGSSCQPTNIFNVTVAVRFNASVAQLVQIQNAFSGASQVLFDATDGQAQFGQVSIFNNSTGSNGHFWITAAEAAPPTPAVGAATAAAMSVLGLVP